MNLLALDYYRLVLLLRDFFEPGFSLIIKLHRRRTLVHHINIVPDAVL